MLRKVPTGTTKPAPSPPSGALAAAMGVEAGRPSIQCTSRKALRLQKPGSLLKSAAHKQFEPLPRWKAPPDECQENHRREEVDPVDRVGLQSAGLDRQEKCNESEERHGFHDRQPHHAGRPEARECPFGRVHPDTVRKGARHNRPVHEDRAAVGGKRIHEMGEGEELDETFIARRRGCGSLKVGEEDDKEEDKDSHREREVEHLEALDVGTGQRLVDVGDGESPLAADRHRRALLPRSVPGHAARRPRPA